jgi:hypothetical protein
MKVEDFETGLDITTLRELEAILKKRHGAGINSFWLGHVAGGFPAINIVVKGDLAHVHYFPNEDHPGFASLAKLPGPTPNETSVFFIRPKEKIWVLNDEVVPFSEALKAAQEFALSEAMPKCIQWRSLVLGE